MSATVAPAAQNARKRQASIRQLYVSALVMNTYLRWPAARVSDRPSLLALNFRTQTKYANVKPLCPD